MAAGKHFTIDEMRSVTGPATLVFLGTIIVAIGGVWAAIRRAETERSLREKSEEIADLNRRIVDLVTGGDSYAYLQLSPMGTGDIALVTLVHQGEAPLHDVSVRIVDLAEFQRKLQKGISLLGGDTTFRVGNVASRQAQMIGRFRLVEGHPGFNVFFSARNGFWSQQLRIARVDGEWIQATRVRNSPTDGEEITLLERIPDSFPRNADGEVPW